MGGIRLALSDLVVSLLWVFSGAIVRMVATSVAIALNINAEAIKLVLTVLDMFIFAWLGKATGGASYNPVTTLYQISARPSRHSLFTLAARIPAQALGSLAGVTCVKYLIPRGGQGPQLKVGMRGGMIAEGLLTFAIVSVALFVSTRGPTGYFLSTWITSLAKLSLSILGADYTGPAMNPATAFGWAYARGQHRTKEHICVYWVAPLEATLLAVWFSRFLVPLPPEQRRRLRKENIKKD